MTQAMDVSRRTIIVVGGAGSALALVGCSTAPVSNGDQGTGPSEEDAGGGPPVEVAKLADVPVGGSIAATHDGKPILLAQPTAGTVVAFSAICTHRGCVVEPAKSEFACPCHGSRYDAATGAVLSGPAPLPLPKISVTVTGDTVLAG